MKIIYLDQLHWIEIAKHINGNPTKEGTDEALNHILGLSKKDIAIFPLSISHYYETLKQSDSGRRQRLAQVMRQLSRGYTVSALRNIVNSEIELALVAMFSLNHEVRPVSYIGKGFEHTFGRSLNIRLEWPNPEKVPEDIKQKIENDIFEVVENALLSGVINGSSVEHLFPKMDLSADIKFRDYLMTWKGCASSATEEELSRQIYAITYQDIFDSIFSKTVELGISTEQFVSIGEEGMKRLIDMMPTRKVDMWLRDQWARNGGLIPKNSDLNDWCYVGSAIPYCDFVVTESQMDDLLSRSAEYKSKVTSELSDLIGKYA